MKLQDLISAGLNGIEAGVDTKQEVRQRILEHVEANYIETAALKDARDMSLALVVLLNRVFSIEFTINDGVLMNTSVGIR